MRSKGCLVLSFLFTLLFTFPLFAPDLPSQIRQLQEMTYRPSIQELKQVLQPWPTSNPFKGNPTLAEELYEEKFPTYIATLEANFPNATWAVLGRDAAIFGNGLEAFYESVGQTGRVKYLHASSESFDSYKVSAGEFLKSNGFDPAALAKEETPPYIILDMTSFQSGSQVSELLKIGWSLVPNPKKFNAISLGGYAYMPIPGTYSGHYPKNVLKPGFDANRIIRSQESNIQYFGFAKEFLSIDTSDNGKRLYGYSPYQWGESYGIFEKGIDGIVRGQAGNPRKDDREEILHTMYALVEKAKKASFHHNVLASAKAFGEVSCLNSLLKVSRQ